MQFYIDETALEQTVLSQFYEKLGVKPKGFAINGRAKSQPSEGRSFIMKKIACIVLTLLCLSAVAMAESVPSRTTTDLTTVTVTAENMPADATFAIIPITQVDPEEMTPEMQVLVDACNTEISKLNEGGSVVDYFGEVTNADGEVRFAHRDARRRDDQCV